MKKPKYSIGDKVFKVNQKHINLECLEVCGVFLADNSEPESLEDFECHFPMMEICGGECGEGSTVIYIAREEVGFGGVLDVKDYDEYPEDCWPNFKIEMPCGYKLVPEEYLFESKTALLKHLEGALS